MANAGLTGFLQGLTGTSLALYKLNQARQAEIAREEAQKEQLKLLQQRLKGAEADRQLKEQQMALELSQKIRGLQGQNLLGQAFQQRFMPEATQPQGQFPGPVAPGMTQQPQMAPGTPQAGLVGMLGQAISMGVSPKEAMGMLPESGGGKQDEALIAAVAKYPQIYEKLPKETRERIAAGLANASGFMGFPAIDERKLQETIRHNKAMEQNIGRIIESNSGMVRINPMTGTIEPVLDAQGQPVKGKMTGEQSAAMGFGIRAGAAHNIATAFEAKGISSADPQSLLGKIPGIGNFLVPSDLQQYAQAKLDFVTAVLRKESGAAISADEYIKEDRKYFPQPGDTVATIAQKRESRKRAIKILEIQSGRQLPKIESQLPSTQNRLPTSGATRMDQ